MIRIKNTADDRTKHLLHRTATKFEIEPILGDKRIRLGKYIDVPDAYYERVKHLVAPWIKNGMVEVIKLDADVFVAAEVVAPVDVKIVEEVVVDVLPEIVPAEVVVAPVAEVTEVYTTPVVDDKGPFDASRKGPGKKKLF